jgi:hypothetical protein
MMYFVNGDNKHNSEYIRSDEFRQQFFLAFNTP